MICTIISSKHEAKEINLVPKCGDYCDECGDCLHCFGEDQCHNGFDHDWTVVAEELEEGLSTFIESRLPEEKTNGN